MDDIKRALLGNHEAAKRLTEAGVLLPCWRCGGEAELQEIHTGGKPVYAVSCKKHHCGAYGCAHQTKENAVAYWNIRPAPPIGRCGECKHFYEDGDETSCSVNNLVFYKEHEYCSKFEPKDGEENGRTAAD